MECTSLLRFGVNYVQTTSCLERHVLKAVTAGVPKCSPQLRKERSYRMPVAAPGPRQEGSDDVGGNVDARLVAGPLRCVLLLLLPRHELQGGANDEPRLVFETAIAPRLSRLTRGVNIII
ncbi:unnamed protein product [Ixodes persulcatus]